MAIHETQRHICRGSPWFTKVAGWSTDGSPCIIEVANFRFREPNQFMKRPVFRRCGSWFMVHGWTKISLTTTRPWGRTTTGVRGWRVPYAFMMAYARGRVHSTARAYASLRQTRRSFRALDGTSPQPRETAKRRTATEKPEGGGLPFRSFSAVVPQ